MRLLLATVVALPAMLSSFIAGPEGMPAVMTLTGEMSEVREGSVERITDAKRWEAVWDLHRGDAKGMYDWAGRPEIDFERYMVLAIFAGERTNHSGWSVESWRDAGGHILVRYDARTFQTASFDGPDHGVATRAYGFFILPRSARPMRLEENVQGLIRGEPIWKESHRFPALGE